MRRFNGESTLRFLTPAVITALIQLLPVAAFAAETVGRVTRVENQAQIGAAAPPSARPCV